MKPGDLVWYRHKGRVKSGRLVSEHRRIVRLEPTDKAGRRDNVPKRDLIVRPGGGQ